MMKGEKYVLVYKYKNKVETLTFYDRDYFEEYKKFVESNPVCTLLSTEGD